MLSIHLIDPSITAISRFYLNESKKTPNWLFLSTLSEVNSQLNLDYEQRAYRLTLYVVGRVVDLLK